MCEDKWLWFKNGKFPQCCCACGRPVPAGNPRRVLKREFNPLTVAVIKHPACRGVILYNRQGERIEEVPIP